MIENKKTVFDFWVRQSSAADAREMEQAIARVVREDVDWTGFRPFDHCSGRDEMSRKFWLPLKNSFPDVKRECFVFLSGEWAGKDWVSGMGVFNGTFANDFVGIPATGKPAALRFGEFCALENGKIVVDYLLLDMIDLMRQAGYRVLPQSPGNEDFFPTSSGPSGLLLGDCSDVESRKSLALVEGMINGLGKFDGSDFGKMNQTDFWSPGMHWYGPCGIGTSLNRKEYERNHQAPFLTAFPDRKGGTHKARIAEGAFIASTGWPSVVATHAGPYLGAPASNRKIGMRVADWWRRDGDLLVQNWVFIDLPDLFMQFGIDLFAALDEQVRRKN
jgi:predicted ester cyclase